MRAVTARQIGRFGQLLKAVAAGVASYAVLEELADLCLVGCGFY